LLANGSTDGGTADDDNDTGPVGLRDGVGHDREDPVTSRRRAGWVPGVVVGVAGGFATLEIPTVGWLIVVAFAILALVVGPRLMAIGGLFTGLGAIWLVLLGRVALECRAPAGEIGCSAPGIEQWLAVGAGMLAIGIGLTIVAVVRTRGSPS
jgi:hypothetical protein